MKPSNPMDGFDIGGHRWLSEQDQQRIAEQRRRAVRNLAGWPRLDKTAFLELCAALKLEPKEGRAG